MKLTIFIILIVIACLLMNNQKALSSEKKIIPLKKVYKLSNGLKLITVEWHSLPMVHFSLMIKAGSALDPQDKAGVADATAFLLTQGTKSKNALQIAEEIDFIGAKLSSQSEEDASYVELTILKKHLDKGLDIFQDILLNPSFPQDEIERWKKRTIAVLAQEKAEPAAIATKKFKNFIFGSYPYGNILSEKSINEISQKDIAEFYEKYYRPNNAVLAIVGDINPESIKKNISKLLGKWENKEIPAFQPPAEPKFTELEIQLLNKEDLNQAQVRFGYITTKRNNPDYFPIILLNYILGGGGFSSRLMKEIRSNKGYTYGINSSFDMFKHAGIFSIRTFTKNETVPAIVEEILNQLKILKEKGVTEEELNHAKSYFKGSFARRFERPEKIADQILDVELYNLGDNFLDEYKSRIDAVSIEQVKEVINKYIQVDKAGILIFGKAKDYVEEIKKIGKVEVKDYSE